MSYILSINHPCPHAFGIPLPYHHHRLGDHPDGARASVPLSEGPQGIPERLLDGFLLVHPDSKLCFGPAHRHADPMGGCGEFRIAAAASASLARHMAGVALFIHP